MLRLTETEMLDLSVVPHSAASLDSADSLQLGRICAKPPFVKRGT